MESNESILSHNLLILSGEFPFNPLCNHIVLMQILILQNFVDVETICQLTNVCETILEVTHFMRPFIDVIIYRIGRLPLVIFFCMVAFV